MDTTGFGPLDMSGDEPVELIRNARDGRVCVCGHSAGAHTPVGSEDICNVGKHGCACRKLFPVLTAANVRSFMSKTVGPGPQHALARGVSRSLDRGIGIQWRPDLTCGRCGAENVKLTPVAVTPEGVIARKATPHNFLLCAECRTNLPIEPELTSWADKG